MRKGWLVAIAVASLAACRGAGGDDESDRALGVERGKNEGKNLDMRDLRDPYRGMGPRPLPAPDGRPSLTPEGDPTTGVEPIPPEGPLLNPLTERGADAGVDKPLEPNRREPESPSPGSAPELGGQPTPTPGYERR